VHIFINNGHFSHNLFIKNMYNNRNSSGRGFSRNNNFQRRGAPQRGKPRFQGENINTSLFIKKAEEFTTIEETVTVNNFADFNLHPDLLTQIKNKGYTKPTPIQDQAIPHIIAGKDVLGLANTGTGKTAAFALPLINKILNNPGCRIIVLAPTRELAQQIREEIRSFTFGMRVYVTLAIGGAYLREQIIDIKRGPHIIIGTPGRIKDLGQRRVIRFDGMDTLVLDEVDRMLDMGFIGDIKHIVDQIPTTRQTLFFSATVNRNVESLINSFLRDPVKISIESKSASCHVDQDIVRVQRGFKEQKLHEMMALPEFKKVLIFGATHMIVDKLSESLYQKGFRAQGLHGGKRQSQRQTIVRNFKENKTNILVATDVAARGLDIADISHVINYDKPNNYQDYIHRIGRTGRGNSKGFALTFVD